MAGIRDVAKRAHVSTSTVSLVLNNNGYVSQDTRSKVMKAMEELNYVPNELARNLYHSKTNIIGIILPDIAHPFFGTFAKYAERELYKHGYMVMLCSTDRKKNGEKEYINMLNRQIVDGIIVGSHTLDVEEYKNSSRPIISLDRYINDDIPIVRSDHKKGGMLAAEEIIKNGCKNVLQLKGNSKVNTPAHQHHYYFEKVLRENGVPVHVEEIPLNQWTFKNFENYARENFQKHPGVDAIYGADLVALAFLKVAQEQGVRVPEDLKVIGYDGTIVTQMSVQPLTVVSQDIQKLAKEAVSLLINKIDGKPVKENQVIVDVKLRKGKTTV